MKKLPIYLFLICTFLLNAQDDPPSPPPDFYIDECPEVVNCISSTTMYSGYLPWGDLSTAPVDNCGGVPWVQSNLKFEAQSTEVEVIVTWNTDDNMKTGIIFECGQYSTCMVGSICEDDGEITIFADNLWVGHTYILFVDACNAYEIDYEVEVNPGPLEEFIAIDQVWLDKERNCENGLDDNKYCLGANLYANIGGPDENEIDFFKSQEGLWKFSLDGPVSEIFEVENPEDIELNLSVEGEYVFSLESIQFNCESYPINATYEFEVVNVDEHFEIHEVCEHDLNEWNPGNGWIGPNLSEAGYHVFEYEDECDCPFIQDITIEKIEEVYEDHELVLCPDDYPYEFFDGYILDYEPDNYDVYLRFDEQSLVEDYYGENCDSLIHLFVINEKPEERCSSCDLPIILEKSKIVYCVPFDNGTFDVSGKGNRIFAEGIGYDNNGPVSNPLWEAVFDGRDDHARIPHIDDINTSVFSFDLHFNKDERFENGEIETIISKGDLGDNNLRYAVQIAEETENQYTLLGNFYTETSEIQFVVPELNRDQWYGATFVVEQDSISMYLDGYRYDQKWKPQDLKGNESDMYMASEVVNGELNNFYDGRLDNFKYWKQKLSGQDVLYLYYPEKEFEVYVEMFLTCCESGTYEDKELSFENLHDTIFIPEASPTGYDSVFYLSVVPLENRPVIEESLLPGDIIIQKDIKCDETCGQMFSWNEPNPDIFSDACGIVSVETSHQSPLYLDESESYIEVVYTATNECGHKNSFSFTLELVCEAEDYVPLPVNNDFNIISNASCESSSLNKYCTGTMLNVAMFFTDELTLDSVFDYSNYDSLQVFLSIDSSAELRTTYSDDNHQLNLMFDEVGHYTVCIDKIEDLCDVSEINKCIEVEIHDRLLVDYGRIYACYGEVEEVLPEGISEELKLSILDKQEAQSYIHEYENDCSCSVQEVISIRYSNQDEPAELVFEICRSDLPIEILGQQFDDEMVYENEEIVFEGAAMIPNSDGGYCDSTIVLTIDIYEDVEVYEMRQICEGESYLGYSQSGEYVIEEQSYKACDSTTILNLVVHESVKTQVIEEICEGEEINGYTESGSYVDVLIGENGCDSIVNLELQVLLNTEEEIVAEICPGESYLGYEEEGSYIEHYINSTGCDSTLYLNLIVLPPDHIDCVISSTTNVKGAEIIIYPNPTMAKFCVDSGDLINLVRLELYDCTGRKNRIKKIGDCYDISHLENGVYFLKAEFDKYMKTIQVVKL